MKKKKIMKRAIGLVLIVALIIVMCSCTKVGTGNETAAATTDNEATKSESSNTTDTVDEKPEPSEETKHDPYEIEIYTFLTGSSVATIGIALAEMINENSSWLTATALESQTQNATASILLEEKAETAIGYVVLPVVINGYPPFTEPNTDLRTIFSFGCVSNTFMTLDPDIKTMQDLEGKNVMLGTVGGYPRHDLPIAMLDYMDIKCNLTYGSFSDSVDALVNGQVDVIFGGGSTLASDYSKWTPSGFYTELFSRFDVYSISVDKEAAKYAEDLYNFHLNPSTVTIPEGSYIGSQKGDVTVMADYLGFCCNKDLPDDVITEILRIMTDHCGEFADYTPAGAFITPENMAKVDVPEYIHDAAKAFYEDKGLGLD